MFYPFTNIFFSSKQVQDVEFVPFSEFVAKLTAHINVKPRME